MALLQKGWAKRAIVADSDPLVRAIWECWQSPGQQALVLRAIAEWQAQFSQTHATIARNAKGEPIRLYFSSSPVQSWTALKMICETPNLRPISEVAAASLVLRKLTFGGVVRFAQGSEAVPGKNSRLNIKYVSGQLAKLARWQYRFPPIYPAQVLSSAQSAIDLVDKTAGTIAAWVDPPYYLPRADYGRMCPAYPGHRPHAAETMDFALYILRKVAAIPNVGHLIYSNYSSQQHDFLVDRILSDFDQIQTIDRGRLNSLYQGNGKPSVLASERIWIAQKTEIMGMQKQLCLI